jgi:hypothetical protein
VGPFREVVVAVDATGRTLYPERLLDLGRNVVVDRLYIGRFGQDVVTDLHDEGWHLDGFGMLDRQQFIGEARSAAESPPPPCSV